MSQYQLNSNYMTHNMEDRLVLTNTKTGEFLNLNDSAAFIWNLLSQEFKIDEIQEKIQSEYEIDGDSAKKDILEFISKLRALKILN